MPDVEEDVLRELMLRSTEDLFASPAAAAHALRRQRRHRTRARVLGVTGIAAAAGLAVGTITTVSGSGTHPATGPGGPAPVHSTAQLTVAEKTLYGLSSAAAATQRPAGRYVILRESSTDSEPGGKGSETGPRASVINTVTGFSISYQGLTGSGATVDPWPPGVLDAPPGSLLTLKQLDAMPTSPAALRAFLLAQAKQLLAQARVAAQALAKDKVKDIPKVPDLTDDDLVFDQAANLLWDPRLSPDLRAAVYRVLADTPGVRVKTGVTDSSGRPAVEISRVSSQGENVQTFENPKTGATLESAWAARGGGFVEDLYLSITYTNDVPANVYQG
jgi:hypothetical protein